MSIVINGSTGITVPAGASGSRVPQAQEVSEHVFPSGTRVLFAQTAAPTGWTKDTTHNNKALRVVSGTAGSGGSVAFTTAFASQAVAGSISNTTAGGTVGNTTAGGTVGNTTLTVNQMPSHRHGFVQKAGSQGSATGTQRYPLTELNDTQYYTQYEGGGAAHNHAFTGTAHSHAFTGTAHNHTFTGTAIDLAVQYVDAIIATKD